MGQLVLNSCLGHDCNSGEKSCWMKFCSSEVNTYNLRRVDTDLGTSRYVSYIGSKGPMYPRPSLNSSLHYHCHTMYYS